MANKVKKLFVIGSVVSGLFMAITACNFAHSSQPSSQDSSNQESSELLSSSSLPSSSQESSKESSSSQAPSSSSSVKPVIVLTSISAVSNKESYEIGDELDITVTANYSDGNSENVSNYQVTGFNNRAAGEQNLTITFDNKSCTLKVIVNEPVLVDITVGSKKDSLEWGEELDLVVTANYSDGSSVVVTDYQVQGYNAQVSGDQEVLITYQGKTYTLNVKVNDPILVSITVDGQKDTYEWGENLQLGVEAHYSDGSTVTVNEFQVEGFNNEQPGEQTVVITFEGKTCSFKTTVNNPVLVNISAESQKETYEWGEELDIVVTGTYSDNSSKEITDYTVEGFNKEQSGEQTVTVKYDGKTYTFKVTVNNPVLTSITAVSNKESYEYGEELDVVVVAHYSDGSSVEITNYTVEGFNSREAGEQTLTFSYEGKSCSLEVSINEKHDYFPKDKLSAFLQIEAIQVTVPCPSGPFEWFDSVLKEQDGTNYFTASTKDEGKVGTDSIADQYAVLLEKEGWGVKQDENGYTAIKDNGDAVITFLTKNGTFTCNIAYYCEFPEYMTSATAIKNSVSLTNGDTIILGSLSNAYTITGFENGAFTTSVYKAISETDIDNVAKNVWRFTINKVGTNVWTISDVNGRKLGATGLGQLAWDEGSTEWTVVFTNNSTVFRNVNTAYGRLCYDPNTRTVTTKESAIGTDMSYPQIFKTSNKAIIYPTAIALDGRESVAKGKTTRLSLTYIPENSNALNEITWSSSNESVATINKDGVVTGVSAGTTTITAQTKSKGVLLETTYTVEVVASALDSWTIMIYMCGSDLESGYYHFATSDIREILSVSGQPDDVNIIIETGGTSSWSYPGIDAKYLSHYHVENKSLVLDEKITRASMGKQSTFEDFLNWGLTEYPAEKTGVVLWNHGGALGGCCYDENYYDDSLLNSEAAAAFNNVFTAHGINKLEFVGYDACLMQIQDVAEFNSKYFNYMLGSEEAEDGYGWDYDNWVDDLYAGKDTPTILKAACDSFVSSCGNNSDQGLSYLKLNNMANYFEKFEAMAGAIKETAKNNYSEFKSVINSSKRFEAFSSYGVMDGLDFLNKLGNKSRYNDFADQINDVKTAYNNVVGYCKKGTGAGNTTGLAVIAATSCSYPSTETHFTNWRSIFK